jgi:SAM-dependent methyltransferase
MPVETVSCDLCGADDPRLLFETGDTLHHVPGTFPVVRCRTCGLVYVSPRPTGAELPRYYPPDSYEPHQEGHDQGSGRADVVRRWLFAPDAGRLRRALGSAHNVLSHRAFVSAAREPAGRVLDVGCGTGGYLRTWQSLGWVVEGVEPAPAAAARATATLRAPVHVGTIDEVALPEESFDLVTMCHSLEHVPSPRRALARIWRTLRPAGRLLVMVPNFASWERAVFGASWFGLEVPRHLYHFEPDTLRELFLAAGFIDVKIGGSANPGTLLRHIHAALGRAPTPTAPRAVSTLLMAALLPAAVLRRSKALWAIAARPQ